MRTLTLAIAFGLIASTATAACLKLDCSQDPQAWADMFGNSPAQKREQQIARDAARAEVRRRQMAGADVTNIGIKQRLRLLYSIEDTFTRLVGQPYYVLSAIVVQRADNYLFCGSGVYGDGQGGVFVFDTAPGGIHTLTADRATFDGAGCNGSPSVVLR